MSFTTPTEKYAELYKGEGTRVLTLGRLTSNMGDSRRVELEGDLSNYRTVKFYDIDMSLVGMTDYDGAYHEVDLSGEWNSYRLQYDRSMKMVFDKLAREFDGNKGGMDLGTLLQRAITEKSIPEIDASVFEKINSVISGANRIATPTQSTILKQFETAIDQLNQMNIGSEKLAFYVSYETYRMLTDALQAKNMYTSTMTVTTASGVDIELPSYNGVPIYRVQNARFYPKIKRFTKAENIADKTKVGYQGMGTLMSWLLVPTSFVNPIVKLSDIKIKMDSIENTTNRNNEAAYNIFYDTIIEKPLEQYFIGSAADPATVTVSGSAPVAPLNDTKVETKTTETK